MRVLIAALLLTAALAGCAEGTELPASSDGDHDDHASHDGNVTLNETIANNTAPLAILTADGLDAVNGTINATAGQLNFTLDGSDADGDNLTWSIAVNGTELATGDMLPAAFNHTFTAGNHTVNLTVSDGNLTGMAGLLIVIEDVAIPEADPNAPVDMGWYMFDPATELCHVKSFEDLGGVGRLYRSALSGGDWVLAEDNGVAGLQVADSHPVGAPLFGLDTPGCKDGDLIVV